MNGRILFLTMCSVFLASLVISLALGLRLGLSRPMESDSHYYLQAATSLAEGHGYKIRDTFWPDKPTMSRSPGWPFAVSLALRVFPSISADLVMRCLCLLINAFAAAAVFLLAKMLFDRVSVAVLAGLGYAIHPVALSLAYDGDSEPLFVLLTVIGVLLLISTRRRSDSVFCALSSIIGSLLLGLACLVRPNFLLWPVFLGILMLWGAGKMMPRIPDAARRGIGSVVLIGAILFFLPSTLWAVRNYRVCGHFPVFSTIGGQTFYGGNNSVVAREFKYWGYWVFPNSIPGEQTMAGLSTTMSEHEVDQYYYGKGREYVQDHLVTMPWLWLGKLVRAYVPIPWHLSPGTVGVSAFRWLLYAAAGIGILRWWGTVDVTFRMVLSAMVLTNVATILVFWGCARFAFPLDPFLLPFAAAGLCGGYRIVEQRDTKARTHVGCALARHR